MVFKRWLRGGGGGQDDDAHTIEDLIVLERYDEAEERLKARLKSNPGDLHSHLKLADVYTALRQVGKAVEEYVHAAEEYAQDGFYDKGIALLSRAQKLAPADDSLRVKILAYQQVKGLEHKRAAALEGQRKRADDGTRLLLLQRFWHHLASGQLVQRLAPEQITRLFAAGDLESLPPGTVLVREGEERSEMFLLLDGVVEAGIAGAGTAGACVRTFGARDILGDSAVFERRPWPADYRVTETAVVLRVDRAGLETALRGNPDPRRFLDVIREQRHDREVAKIVSELRAKG